MKAKGFTLVELLVSMAITVGLLLVMMSVVSGVNHTWQYTSSKVYEFRESRDAFEALTRRISQATLNTYWDYNNPNNPTSYQRQSQLRFISGVATGIAGSGSVLNTTNDNYHPTHAIFFQAPLGYTQAHTSGTDPLQSIDQLENLLNTWGYFIEWNTDGATATNAFSALQLKPPFVTSPDRYRFRLMEMMEPSENMALYQYTSGPDTTGSSPRNTNYVTNPQLANLYAPSGVTPGLNEPNGPITGREWFTNWLFGPAGSTYPNGSQAHSIAENVIALILLPQLSTQGQTQSQTQAGGTTYPAYALAPHYNYDSSSVGDTYLTTNGKPGTDGNLNSRNQLPPIVQVTLVAIDETSARRMEATLPAGFGGKDPFGIAQGNLFQNAANYSQDLAQLEANIQQTAVGSVQPAVTLPNGLKYSVYTTNVAIKAAKWSRSEQN